MMPIHPWKTSAIALAWLALSLAPVAGCSGGHKTGEGRDASYQSARIQGATQRINLDAVQKAFWASKGGDFNTWMASFEKRVNEIYDGKELVAIDASRKNDRLVVTGYIDTKKQQGYHPGDDKLFTIEQTGEATHDQVPMRVAGSDGRTYYEGHHSLLDNPFLQAFMISHMMGGFGGHYYTPYGHYGYLNQYRHDYRMSPGYGAQQQANQGFFSKMKQRVFGGGTAGGAAAGVQSKRGFGAGGFSAGDGAKRRSWGGTTTGGATTGGAATSGGGWGGRRSSGGGFGAPAGGGFGGGFGGGSRRSWGGRRH